MNIQKVNTIMSGVRDYVYNFVFDLYSLIMTHVSLPPLTSKNYQAEKLPDVYRNQPADRASDVY